MAGSMELTCACQQVALQVDGRPILSVECLCRDCQNAGATFSQLPGAAPVLDQKGATPFVLYRKDRVACLEGAAQLREHRLTPDSKTRQVIATCCNTPVFLELGGSHWLSLYGALWPRDALPALDLRTMTRDAPAGVALPPDVPNPRTHTLGFYARLFVAWAAMGFRAPNVGYVKGSLDASGQ